MVFLHHRVKNWKTKDHGLVDGVIMSTSLKSTYRILRYSNIPLSLDHISLKQIHHVSLKGFQKQVATRHKMILVISYIKLIYHIYQVRY